MAVSRSRRAPGILSAVQIMGSEYVTTRAELEGSRRRQQAWQQNRIDHHCPAPAKQVNRLYGACFALARLTFATLLARTSRPKILIKKEII